MPEDPLKRRASYARYNASDKGKARTQKRNATQARVPRRVRRPPLDADARLRENARALVYRILNREAVNARQRAKRAKDPERVRSQERARRAKDLRGC